MKWFRYWSGDAFVRRWFAVWPITIGCETRWLEVVAVEYRRVFYVGDGAARCGERAIRFVDRTREWRKSS